MRSDPPREELASLQVPRYGGRQQSVGWCVGIHYPKWVVEMIVEAEQASLTRIFAGQFRVPSMVVESLTRALLDHYV